MLSENPPSCSFLVRIAPHQEVRVSKGSTKANIVVFTQVITFSSMKVLAQHPNVMIQLIREVLGAQDRGAMQDSDNAPPRGLPG